MSKNSERTLSSKEVNDFLNDKKKDPYKMKGHQWSPMKGVGKNYCTCCGLLMLRNKATDWCVDKGCNYQDHPQYYSAMKRLTKQRW